MKENDSIKKKLNKVGLILLLFFGGVIIYVIHDEHRRKEAAREFYQRQKEMNTPYNIHEGYNNHYQPSFGSSEPSKTSNRETCRSHHCPCHTRRSWLEYKGYNYCPSCNHATSYHHD